MKLPGADALIVPRRKIEDYLLNLEHPVGGGKAKFFIRFGFRREQWEELATALRHHGEHNEVRERLADADGCTYLVEGRITTPSGRRPRVRTVWLVEAGELAPRFMTAYPLEA
jgi:hypothetical protein